MLSKLPVITETPFIPGTPGQAAYSWCPPPTPPPPPPPPPISWFSLLPGVTWDSAGCRVDFQVLSQWVYESGTGTLELPPGCVLYNVHWA